MKKVLNKKAGFMTTCPGFDVFLESGKEGCVLVLEKCFCVRSFHCAEKRMENEEWVGMINTLYLDQKFTVGKVSYLDSNWMLMKL